jgi:2'-5' RNA ligase
VTPADGANWFVALPVERTRVAAPPAPHGIRVFAPEDLHLTVAFLGACGEERARRAWDAVDAELTARPQAPISFTWGAMYPMGSPHRYSALSLLLDRGREEAAALLSRLRPVACRGAAVVEDERPPLPHVTVARPKRTASAPARRAGLEWAGTVKTLPAEGVLQEIALYTWARDRAARLFRIVDVRALND